MSDSELNKLVIILLPFLMAYIIQSLHLTKNRLITNLITLSSPRNATLDVDVQNLVTQVTKGFFDQFSFIISMLLSAISALVFTLNSIKPWLGAIVTFIMIVIIFIWIIRWQPLAEKNEHKERHSREMIASALFVNSVLLFTTLVSNSIL